MSNDVPVLAPSLPAAESPGPVWHVPQPPRRRFQDVIWKHVLLFLLTLTTTTLVGAEHYASFLSEFRMVEIAFSWKLLMRGLWYSLTIIAILGAHEMGHYLACRRYRVDASLPYFLPLYIPIFGFQIGTLGAVIRIREAFPNRTVLFDIGVAGPIAGFVVLLVTLITGLHLSYVVPAPTDTQNVLYLGEPLLFKWAAWILHGRIADGLTLNMHPMVAASWFGMLATAINLLPFGQMDGGHITYATLGKWATPISIVTVGTAVVMTAFVTAGWALMTVLMLAMLIILGPRHPRVIYEFEPLGRGRRAVAIFALIMLIVCFTPVPVSFPK